MDDLPITLCCPGNEVLGKAKPDKIIWSSKMIPLTVLGVDKDGIPNLCSFTLLLSPNWGERTWTGCENLSGMQNPSP